MTTTILLGSPSPRAPISLLVWVLLVLVAQPHPLPPVLGAPLVVSVPFGQDPLPLIQNAFLSSNDVEVSFAPLSTTGVDSWLLSSSLSLSGTQRLLLQRDSTVSNATRIVLDCGNQGRAAFLSGSSTLALRDIFFENCAAADSEGGGAILLQENAQLDVFRGGFIRNSAEFGGAISFQNSSQGTIFAAVFSFNRAVNRGGAIAAWNAAKLRLSGCTFTQNNAERGGGMTALDESTVAISSSQFTGNRALYSGSLDPGGSAVVEFEDCRFENETVSNNGGVMEVTGRVAITYRSCVFKNNLPTQLTVRGADESLTSFYNCTFRFTSAVDDAAQAVHFWVFSPALYVGCSFSNSRSSEVGGALRAGALNLTVIDTVFENNKALSGGAVSFVRGYALFRRCSFKDNSARTAGGALQISTGEDVEVDIENCDFRGGEAVMGGAVNVESDAKVKVSRSEFRNNKANYGGAIALGYSAKVTVKSSELRSNEARYGGAIYQTEDAVLAVEGTDFHDNGHSMRTDYGGALFVTKQAEHCPRFEGGSMTQNKAFYAGGGIYFESRTPPCSTARFASTIRFSRNSATYGKEFASAPAKLVLLESTFIPTLVPSQEFSSVLEVRDHFNQTVRGFIDMSVFLQARFEGDRGYNSTQVQGTVVRQPTDKGLVNFVDIVFLAEDEKIDLKFTSDPELKHETATIEVDACDPDKDVLYRDDDGRLYCLRIRSPSELVVNLVYIAASISVAASVSAQILIVLLRNRCPIKTVGWHFLFLVGIGCDLCIISVFMWTDVTDGMCSLRVWLLSLGLSIILGSMLARLWMHRQNERAVKKLPVKIVNGYTIHPELLPRTTPVQAFIGIGVALVPTLVVMSTWMIVDPPFRDEEIQLKDGDTLRHTMTPECRISSPSGIFAIVLIVIHGLLLVAGCVLSFTLRHLPSCFHESKITVFVMYNTLFVLVATVILASIFHDDKTPLLIIVAVLVLFACGVILLLVCGYKIYLSVLSDSRMISRLQDEITQLNIETVHSQMHIYSIDPVVKSNTLATTKSASIASGPIQFTTGTGTGTDLSHSN